MDKLMIEVALNEAVTKEQNPHVPYGRDEVVRETVACAEAGATIIHFHSRDPKTGEDREGDLEAYAETMNAIQRECDVIISPSYPVDTMETRIGFLEALADYPGTRVEMAGHGVGSANQVVMDRASGKIQGGTVLAPAHEVLEFAKAMQARGIRILLGLRDVGHMRHVQGFIEMGVIEAPLFLNFFLSEQASFGPSPDARGLLMYLDMAPPGVEHHWLVSAYKSPNLNNRINMLAVAMGGHIRTGVGEVPVLDGKRLTNAQQVEMIVDLAQRADREVASSAETRGMLGIPLP